ncbi:unnamed protein product [Mytilus coruscus]|uniref:Uncharacterized protein n=1 Tax=Mytilus coruscus TaxID=42192 RepID=A0A6J8EXS0_MYTCO|nr:unnamed protein product [Mytilus coruscus]
MGKNKRNRSDNSKTGLTPPNKTQINMASHYHQQQQSFSNVLSQAHDTLYTSTPMNSHTTPLTGTFQQNYHNTTNHMNQTFECPNPQIQQTSHCSPNAGPTSNPRYQPPPLPSFPSLPLSQSDGVRSNITMEMLFSTVNIMNQRLERIDFVVGDKLSKLDKKLDDRFNNIETKISNLHQEIDSIKNTQNVHAQVLENEEKHHFEIADRMNLVEDYTEEINTEKNQLKEEYLKLQSHSMKCNLIFGGIIQTDEEEDTDTILKNFIKTELDMPDADEIDFQNVHRLRPRRDGKPRNIIARFTHYKDHERVKKVVPQKLKHKPRFTINQQYPTEISNRRQKLFPKLKELHRSNIRASLVYDQIIINGQPYDPTREEPYIPIHNNQAGLS